MTKGKGILGLIKEINSATKVLTGHDIKFYAKVGWDLKGKQVADNLLAKATKGTIGNASRTWDWRYEILRIDPDESDMVLKLAWKTRSAATHPDKGGDVEENKKVNAAYQSICDEREIKP